MIIVDTDILIDAGRSEQTALDWLRANEQQFSLAISAVTQMELLVGCRNQIEQQKLEKFLHRFQILELRGQISDRAVNLLKQYRLSHGLLIADALIAATAIEHNEPLITKNQRHFHYISALNLLPYP